MAFDEQLGDRIREILGPRADVTERRMFGGLAFLLDGKMFVGIVKDELMVRVGAEAHEAAIARRHARTMDFTGRPMVGYVFVAPPGCKSAALVGPWVAQALAHVATLPAKKPRPRKPARPRVKAR